MNKVNIVNFFKRLIMLVISIGFICNVNAESSRPEQIQLSIAENKKEPFKKITHLYTYNDSQMRDLIVSYREASASAKKFQATYSRISNTYQTGGDWKAEKPALDEAYLDFVKKKHALRNEDKSPEKLIKSATKLLHGYGNDLIQYIKPMAQFSDYTVQASFVKGIENFGSHSSMLDDNFKLKLDYGYPFNIVLIHSNDSADDFAAVKLIETDKIKPNTDTEFDLLDFDTTSSLAIRLPSILINYRAAKRYSESQSK